VLTPEQDQEPETSAGNRGTMSHIIVCDHRVREGEQLNLILFT
jgi:hypothetical protein